MDYGDVNYEIRFITGNRVNQVTNKNQYLVTFKQGSRIKYHKDELKQWINQEDLNCTELIEKFHKKIKSQYSKCTKRKNTNEPDITISEIAYLENKWTYSANHFTKRSKK